MPVDEAWSKIFGAGGRRAATPLEMLSKGSRYRENLDGEPVEGVLRPWWSPRSFTATWEALNDARFWMSLTDFKGMTAVAVQMYLYDVLEKRFEQARADWAGLLGQLFPQAAAA